MIIEKRKRNITSKIKIGLIFHSLSPLFLLTAIRNFSFICFDDKGKHLTCSAFILNNVFILITLFVCLLWFFGSFIFWLIFKYLNRYDVTNGYTITKIKNKDDASLNFFLTLIVPLLISDLYKWQNAVAFYSLIIIIIMLLSKTTLFYANPVLTICGYRIYEFEFEDKNDAHEEKIFIGISKYRINEKNSINFKIVSDNVLYISQRSIK